MTSITPASAPALPATISLCECWARDGIQSWPPADDLEGRLELLNATLAAGFAEVELGSLVHPSVAPRFRDVDDLLRRLDHVPGVRGRVLVPNGRGLERAISLREAGAPITTVGMPISASESHNMANLGKTVDAQLDEVRSVTSRALAEGFDVVVAVATAYGAPREGRVPAERVLDLARSVVECGVGRLMLSDTTGLADPVAVFQLTTAARERFPTVQLVAHFHDTRGRGLVNTVAALQAGTTAVDSCLGGIGGEPDTVDHGHAGESGNVATEDLVSLLNQSGVATGLSTTAVIALSRRLEVLLDRRLRGQVLASGPGLEEERC